MSVSGYWIYQCKNCGKLYYATKRIKRKKCHLCQKSFKFTDCIKSNVNVDSQEIVKLMQHLKERKHKEEYFDLIEELNKLRQ